MSKVNNIYTTTMCEICSKLTIKTRERRQCRRYVFIVNFEDISYLDTKRQLLAGLINAPFLYSLKMSENQSFHRGGMEHLIEVGWRDSSAWKTFSYKNLFTRCLKKQLFRKFQKISKEMLSDWSPSWSLETRILSKIGEKLRKHLNPWAWWKCHNG